jgi:hypothetical protein
MDIPYQLQKIFLFLAKDRFIAVLKKIALPFMAMVKGNGIAGKNFPHQVTQRTFAGSDKKMEVVV